MATVIDTLVTVLGFEGDTKELDQVRSKIRGVAEDINAVARTVGIAGGAITGAFALAAKSAIGWETSFTDVRKTVNGTDEDLAKLEQRLRDMAKQDVPLPHGELAEIAALAGQLGIGNRQYSRIHRNHRAIGQHYQSFWRSSRPIVSAVLEYYTNRARSNW